MVFSQPSVPHPFNSVYILFSWHYIFHPCFISSSYAKGSASSPHAAPAIRPSSVGLDHALRRHFHCRRARGMGKNSFPMSTPRRRTGSWPNRTSSRECSRMNRHISHTDWFRQCADFCHKCCTNAPFPRLHRCIVMCSESEDCFIYILGSYCFIRWRLLTR